MSQLKLFKGLLPNRHHILDRVQGLEVNTVKQLVAILDRKLKKKGNRVIVQLVREWEGQSTLIGGRALDAGFCITCRSCRFVRSLLELGY